MGGKFVKVRTGRVGDHRFEMPPEISTKIDDQWRDQIEARFGFATYDDLRTALRSLN